MRYNKGLEKIKIKSKYSQGKILLFQEENSYKVVISTNNLTKEYNIKSSKNLCLKDYLNENYLALCENFDVLLITNFINSVKNNSFQDKNNFDYTELRNLSQEQKDFLQSCYITYNWWQPVKDIMNFPELLVAKIMDFGGLKDIQTLLNLFTKNYLIKVLSNACVGQFCAKSWYFWHLYLLKINYNDIPSLPTKRV